VAKQGRGTPVRIAGAKANESERRPMARTNIIKHVESETQAYVGRDIKRIEDRKFIEGRARYVDDLRYPRMVYAAFLRSPWAHARIVNIETHAAAKQAGVVSVLTGRSVEGRILQKPLAIAPHGVRNPRREPLAVEKVRYVGQPVVMLVGEEPGLARDALDAVSVEYEPLEVVSDPFAAVHGGVVLYPECEGNVAFEFNWVAGNLESAFAKADRIIRCRFINQRLAPMPLEPRGCVALYEAGYLTFWTSTQVPNRIRLMLAATLGLPDHRIRVIAPDVGGGFGSKLGLYDDEMMIGYTSLALGRPVKWIEGRSESLVASTHGRGQVYDAELAVADDGTFLGLRVSGIADLGAQLEAVTAGPPLFCGQMICGAYRIPAVSFEVKAVFTNKSPTGPYRGAGQPEAAFITERLADLAAAELRLDPVQVRKKNFLRPEEFPVTVPSGVTYDSGRYALALDRALEVVGYEEGRRAQRRAREEGRYLGIGISTFVEKAGFGPSRMMAFQGYEHATVRIERSGKATILTGASPHGQGSETTFAQVAADVLGITPEDVTVLHGDSSLIPMGVGTFGSRGASVGGSAVLRACEVVREKAKRLAAYLLEVADEDVLFKKGQFQVMGMVERAVTMEEVARYAYRGANLPAGVEPGLEAHCVFEPPDFTTSFGAYIAVVEVFPETGEVQLKRFIAVDDIGNVINPMLVDGQLQGGIAQGIAQALWEELVYDETGQLLTGSLVEYGIPRAKDLPSFEFERIVTPTPHNPLGAKGVGEAGCVGAPPAIVNAVVDALGPFNVKHIDMPLCREKIWAAIESGRRDSRSG